MGKFRMKEETHHLPQGRKLYFASDFHLGVPNPEASLAREKSVVAWLESVRKDAHAIYLMGDIFDFWFEYAKVIPKGFIRFQGKLAELRDAGIPIYFFTGNHDMWLFDYFPTTLGIPVYREPVQLHIGTQRLVIGHGDGLGPGETGYKILKAFFNSRICQWLFARIHPNLGMAIAMFWSKRSRIANMQREETFAGAEREYLYHWCKDQEKIEHRDFYVFGHRHLKLDIEIGPSSRYINIGEWVHHPHFGEYDGSNFVVRPWAG